MANATLQKLDLQQMFEDGEHADVFEHIQTFDDFHFVAATIDNAASKDFLFLCDEFPEFQAQMFSDD